MIGERQWRVLWDDIRRRAEGIRKSEHKLEVHVCALGGILADLKLLAAVGPEGWRQPVKAGSLACAYWDALWALAWLWAEKDECVAGSEDGTALLGTYEQAFGVALGLKIILDRAGLSAPPRDLTDSEG